MKLHLVSLASALSLVATHALAQTATDCKPAPFHQGKPIALTTPLDDDTRLGLAQSLYYNLSDSQGGDWPREVIAKAPVCPVDKVGETVVSFGEGDVPLFWAQDRRTGRIVFLSGGPSIAEAGALRKNPPTSTFEVKTPMFTLTVATQLGRAVVRLYDDIPSKEQLLADMRLALAEEIAPIARFDVRSHAVSFAVPTRSTAEAVLFAPFPGAGGPPARLTAPDGVMFKREAGGLRMDGSNFLCPASFGELHLFEIQVFNISAQARDLSCKFGRGDSWVTLFVTNIGKVREQDYFNDSVVEARNAKPAIGEVKSPLATGGAPAPARGQVWRSADGQDGVWVSKIGRWAVTARVTYTSADEAAVAEAVKLMFEAANKSMDRGAI